MNKKVSLNQAPFQLSDIIRIRTGEHKDKVGLVTKCVQVEQTHGDKKKQNWNIIVTLIEKPKPSLRRFNAKCLQRVIFLINDHSLFEIIMHKIKSLKLSPQDNEFVIDFNILESLSKKAQELIRTNKSYEGFKTFLDYYLENGLTLYNSCQAFCNLTSKAFLKQNNIDPTHSIEHQLSLSTSGKTSYLKIENKQAKGLRLTYKDTVQKQVWFHQVLTVQNETSQTVMVYDPFCLTESEFPMEIGQFLKTKTNLPPDQINSILIQLNKK